MYGVYMKMKKINLYLPIKMVQSFKEIAESKGISVSELIRRALDEWLEFHEI